jgi:hypothetical protein
LNQMKAYLHDAVVMQQASRRQGTHEQKDVQKYAAVDVNHGVKKELVVQVKVLLVHHNGLAVE